MDTIKQIQDLKSDLVNSLESEITRIPEYLQLVDNPEKKLNYLIKLLPFILPKMGNMKGYDFDWHNPNGFFENK